jgi:site-specific recombinase XerD
MEMLNAICVNTNSFVQVDARDTFMSILMFAAMLREDEIVNLEKGDAWTEWYEGEEVLMIYIEKKKNAITREGQTVVVGKATRWPASCPLAWFKAHRAMRKRGNKNLSNSKNGNKLSAVTPNLRLKKQLVAIGVDPRPYGSHSLRKGMATAAVAAGVNMRLVMRHGAFFVYVVDSMREKLAVTRHVL